MLIRSIQEIRWPQEADVTKQVRIRAGMWAVKFSIGDIADVDEHTGARLTRWHDRYDVVGVRHHLVESHLVDYGMKEYDDGALKQWQEWIIISPKPCGVVISTCNAHGTLAGGRMLVCARRMERGTLGRPLHVNTPKYVRSQYTARTREGAIRIAGWTKLTTTADFAGMDPDVLLTRFFPFTHKRFPRLYVMYAPHPARIKKKHAKIQAIGERQLSELFDHDQETIWIPHYFADTVLRLVRMRYIP